MNKEEKEAINRIYDVTHWEDGEHASYIDIDNRCSEEDLENCEGFCKAIDTVLNLIQKREKIIDKMADYMKEKDIDEDICTKNVINPQLCNEQLSNCKECIKEYFKKEVEKECEK